MVGRTNVAVGPTSGRTNVGRTNDGRTNVGRTNVGRKKSCVIIVLSCSIIIQFIVCSFSSNVQF
jgi:hypothetical protein